MFSSLLFIMLLLNLVPISAQQTPTTSLCPAEALDSLPVASQALLTASERLYDAPASNTFTDTIQLGEIVTILDVPVCNDFSVYWHVETERGRGWLSDRYFLGSTDGAPTYNPFGVIVPYVETEGFTRLQPMDIDVGLGFSTGGAGGGFLHDEDCLSNYYDLPETLPDAPIFAFYYGCAGTQDDDVFFESGEQITLTEAELSITWWYQHNHTPILCYADVNTDAVAISPSGESKAVSTESAYVCRLSEYQTAMLPEEAYSVPGLWTLQVGEFQVFIEIPTAELPIFSDYSDEDGTNTLWLGGFEPAERIILFVGRPFLGSGDPPTVQYFEVVADENGYFRGAIDTIGSIYVAVGEFENIHWKGRCEGQIDYDAPNESCAARLYEVFWGDSVDSTE